MPTARPASTVPSRPATAGRADSCSARSATEFFEKLIQMYKSVPDLPPLPKLPRIDMAAQVAQLFKFFQTEEVLARFAMNNATIGEATLPIANIYTPENSIFEFSLDQLRNDINIEGSDSDVVVQSFYRFFKSEFYRKSPIRGNTDYLKSLYNLYQLKMRRKETIDAFSRDQTVEDSKDEKELKRLIALRSKVGVLFEGANKTDADWLKKHPFSNDTWFTSTMQLPLTKETRPQKPPGFEGMSNLEREFVDLKQRALDRNETNILNTLNQSEGTTTFEDIKFQDGFDLDDFIYMVKAYLD